MCGVCAKVGRERAQPPPGAIAGVTQMALERRSFHTLRVRMPSGVRGWATPRRSMGIAVKGNPPRQNCSQVCSVVVGRPEQRLGIRAAVRARDGERM